MSWVHDIDILTAYTGKSCSSLRSVADRILPSNGLASSGRFTSIETSLSVTLILPLMLHPRARKEKFIEFPLHPWVMSDTLGPNSCNNPGNTRSTSTLAVSAVIIWALWTFKPDNLLPMGDFPLSRVIPKRSTLIYMDLPRKLYHRCVRSVSQSPAPEPWERNIDNVAGSSYPGLGHPSAGHPFGQAHVGTHPYYDFVGDAVFWPDSGGGPHRSGT